ncbi:MAG: hypothetical protein EP334_03440, partial [Gammaproteobacteria bacterium]
MPLIRRSPITISDSAALVCGTANPRRTANVLKQRIITALVMAVVFAAALFLLEPFGFSMAVALVVIYAAWEWSDLSDLRSPPMRFAYVLLVALLLLASARYLGVSTGHLRQPENGHALLVVTTPWWAFALLWVQGYPSSALLWGSKAVRALMGMLV